MILMFLSASKNIEYNSSIVWMAQPAFLGVLLWVWFFLFQKGSPYNKHCFLFPPLPQITTSRHQ